MARKTSDRDTRRRRGEPAKEDAGEAGRPTREDLLSFIGANPDRATKRDIAKAFALKGEDRAWLKDMLRDFEDEGILQKRSNRLIVPGSLPAVTILDIHGRDPDGGLIGRPTEGGDDAPAVSIRPSRSGSGPAAGIGDRVLARIFRAEGHGGLPVYTGRVLKVFEKTREAVLGVLRQANDGSWRIDPVERRQPELFVEPDARGDGKAGDLVEVEPLRSRRYGPQHGKVIAVLGSLDSEKAVSMIAIHAHEIPHIFPAAALEEAGDAGPATMDGREDWREKPLITIDPADAKDHDDAVMAEPDPDPANPGGVIVTVAIADVAAYVRPGSALDREALRRGNSVYFPDRVVPMLPERISNDLCSLREGEDRPALAVRMVFSADGRKIRHGFHRVMMRSAAKLAYREAQAAIDGKAAGRAADILDPVLRPLWDAYAVLKRGRDSRKPLELDLPERKLLLNPDGTVDRVHIPERLDAHRLIEEFMIQANVAAAESLEQKRQPLLYRIHDAPSLAKQETLREFLQSVGLSLARGPQLRPSQFNQILDRVRGADNETLVNQVVLRSQSQAEYAPGNIGHFGLNLPRYAHFTSPIRRYADLVVHRGLISALGLGKDGLTREEEGRLEEIGAMISAAERRAMAAERDTVDRLIAGYLADRVDESFDATVSGVTKAGLFVQLPQYGADGFIPVSSLGDDYYVYDDVRHAMVGERSSRGFQLGDRVEVRLVEIAPLAGAMRFEMLTAPRPMPRATRSYHKARQTARKAADSRRRTGTSSRAGGRKGRR
ncbi:MAG: ribonuclease R [Rhizobiaceae bacterium]|nr:ribonuclease R [Rhizobiaceae bacterium]MCV0406272.1 ribonuclease R [Rhizobiaceae bacterium]